MSSIDTVVFDIGNVLIPWDPRWLYRKLLPDDEAIERFLREVDFQAWNLRHDAGQPFALGIAEHGARFPHYRPLLQAYFDRFEESMGSAIAGGITYAATKGEEDALLGALVVAVALFVCGLVYLAPALVALHRRHHNRYAIVALDVFAGWSFVGWLAAIVWAFTVVKPAPDAPDATATPKA